MAAQQQRPPSSETLPAILSSSPPGSHRTSGRGINESMTLPPIHSLTRELPTRLEPLHGDPHSSQKHSPPDSNGYHRKRAATGGIAGDMSPSSAFKRRRVDSSDSNEQNSEPPYNSAPASASESHLPRQAKPPQQEQRDTQHLSPPLSGVAAHHQSSRGNVSIHEHRRHHSSGTSNFAAQDQALKQEQISPPAVVVQSPATPATIGSTNNSSAWSNESASFSRRISNPSASLRPTQRKLPPSRLTFQTHNPQRSSLDAALPPSIRSAPPVPVPGQMGAHRPPAASNSTWITNRPILPSRISHGGPATPDLPTPKAVSRESFPSIPTPTSLRLRSVLQPPLPPANPNLPPATSPSGRIPITPAVPSPIPTLGSGTGLADKARFMAKMSEIYDKATLHKNCVTVEEVEKRIREALSSRDQEILQLKKEMFELRKAFTGSTQANATPAGAVDHDGDVTMGGNNTNSISQPLLPRAHSRQASRTLSVSPRPSPHPVESIKEPATATPPNAKSPEEGASSSITMPSVLPMPNGKAPTSTKSPDAPAAGTSTAVKE